MVSKIEALRRLSYAPTTADQQEAFERQIAPETSDRGACILLAAHIETELTAAIESALPKLTEDQRYELFGQDGPLATFARKITMASALGIVGPVSKQNLRLIRHVRNAFAHHRMPIEFSTPEVHAVCMDLVPLELPPFQTKVEHGADNEARGRFESTCASMMLLLFAYTGAKISLSPKSDDETRELDTIIPGLPLP
jgi:hypothetical protein